MDKLTPQEAALYLGQEVMHTVLGRGTLTLDWLHSIFNWADEDHIKLLLRPLSDITEEEAEEVYRLDIGVEPADPVHEAIKEYLLPKPSCHPATFAYLLSRGFDLFNWIESGKAIDKTKVSHG